MVSGFVVMVCGLEVLSVTTVVSVVELEVIALLVAMAVVMAVVLLVVTISVVVAPKETAVTLI